MPRATSMAVMAAMVTGAFGPNLARAATPCPVDPALGEAPHVDGQVQVRTAWLERRILAGARPMTTWSAAWGATFGAAAVGQVIAAAVVRDRGITIDLSVGAGSALVGAVVRAAVISPALGQARRLRRAAPSRPYDCARLQQAERAVARAAAWERRFRSLGVHLLSLSYSAAVGVALGVGFGRPVPGNRQAMIGGAAGQLMLVTMPRPMTRTRAAYLSPTSQARWRLRSAPLVLRGGGGAMVGARF